jgi:ATP-dependent Clp protease adaptor protein ClpS
MAAEKTKATPEQTPQHKAAGNTLVKTKTRSEPPKKYVVLLLNDDFTPMDFVVKIIVEFFGFGEHEANALMMKVHVDGSARMGVFDKGVAESLCFQVNDYSRASGHPLKCIFERE